MCIYSDYPDQGSSQRWKSDKPLISGSGGDARISGSGGEARISRSGGEARISGSGREPRISGSGGEARISGSGGEARISGSVGVVISQCCNSKEIYPLLGEETLYSDVWGFTRRRWVNDLLPRFLFYSSPIQNWSSLIFVSNHMRNLIFVFSVTLPESRGTRSDLSSWDS
mgnify:CR=1 FL=1